MTTRVSKGSGSAMRAATHTTQKVAGGGARGTGRGRRGCDEDQIQAALVVHLTIRAVPGLVWWHTPNGGHRSVAEAGRFKALGVKAGVPDLLALHSGRLFGLELKAERGRVSDAQSAMLADLQAAGAIVAVAYGLDDALATLARWGLLRTSSGSGAALTIAQIAAAG